MQENLVIVESPAKAKTIEKFLGKDFKVLSSYGHIRDLSKKNLGIDIENDFSPVYEISSDKKKLVSELKASAKKAKKIWLASDEDREGEAISWHLAEVLKLDINSTNRIVFHEITKNAILNALENPRHIDTKLVDAQQARRILDRIVGFELSPILWKKIKPSLSAGRVQSVAVRLIVERERDIRDFKSEAYYKIGGEFILKDGKSIKAYSNKRFKSKEEAYSILEKYKDSTFKISNIQKKPGKKTPAAPFTTSTLQQEAARKLGFSVAQTMAVAQKLYEAGNITYMRTDSVNLSELAINTAKSEITKSFGEEYVKIRQYHTKSKGAQEAHEAIRPTYIENKNIKAERQEQRLYELIWKRTIASQMADAKLEKTTATIEASNSDFLLEASGEVIVFDGFLTVYLESNDEENESEENANILPPLEINQNLDLSKITASQKFTQGPYRFTEASLVKKMEELGIGRPSTYAPTISTILRREYVAKETREATPMSVTLLTLENSEIKETQQIENHGYEKNKLVPTDIGMVVNDFLLESFPNTMDFNFTANVEKQFDEIANGNIKWNDVLKKFYKTFHPAVEKAEEYSERKVGERVLGKDPKTGKQISVRIGRFGPIVQKGTVDDEEKPSFASLKKGQHIESLTFEEALELFKLPRNVGEFEEKVVTIGVGRFGPYIRHNNKFVSIPKDIDPLKITLEQSIELIKKKIEEDAKKLISNFEGQEGEPLIQILNGRFGPYIKSEGNNYKILPKGTDPLSLDREACLAMMEKQGIKPPKGKKGTKKTTKKKTVKKTAKKPTKKTSKKITKKTTKK